MSDDNKSLIFQAILGTCAILFFVFVLFHGDNGHHKEPIYLMQNNKLYVPIKEYEEVSKYIAIDTTAEKQYDKDTGNINALVVTPTETQMSTIRIIKALKNNEIQIK